MSSDNRLPDLRSTTGATMTKDEKRKPLRGTRMFSLLGRACLAVQKHGLLLCLVHYLWRFVSHYCAWRAQQFLVFLWKARLVWHWRFSPLVSEEKRLTRDAVCAACEDREVQEPPTGFFRWAFLGHELFPGGLYCGACNCWNWFLALLKTKNTREGHVCPLSKHPGQPPIKMPTPREVDKHPGQPPMPKPTGDCEGCGGKKANGQRGGPPGRRVPGPLEQTEIPRMPPGAMGHVEDIGITVEDGHTLPARID